MEMRGTDHYQFVFMNPHTSTVFQVEREHPRVSWVAEFEYSVRFALRHGWKNSYFDGGMTRLIHKTLIG